MIPDTPEGLRLRRLWDEHRHSAFPAAGAHDSQLREVALYATWLGGVVEAALGRGGRLSVTHRVMLDVREAEGNQSLWGIAADLGEPVRTYVARLLAIQQALTSLPVDGPRS